MQGMAYNGAALPSGSGCLRGSEGSAHGSVSHVPPRSTLFGHLTGKSATTFQGLPHRIKRLKHPDESQRKPELDAVRPCSQGWRCFRGGEAELCPRRVCRKFMAGLGFAPPARGLVRTGTSCYQRRATYGLAIWLDGDQVATLPFDAHPRSPWCRRGQGEALTCVNSWVTLALLIRLCF